MTRTPPALKKALAIRAQGIHPDSTQAEREVAWDRDLLNAFGTIVAWLGRHADGLTPAEEANLLDTAARAAKAFRTHNRPFHEIQEAVREIIATGFPLEDAGQLHSMVTVTNVRFSSMCPHHLYPVIYEAHMSYIPKLGGTVIGLSKLPRVAIELAQRPVLHEQLASDIADVLHARETFASRWPQISSEGSAVTLIGRHTCMCCRGVEQVDALTTVTELRGRFWENNMEEKHKTAIRMAQASRV